MMLILTKGVLDGGGAVQLPAAGSRPAAGH